MSERQPTGLAARRLWTREELILTLSLYFQLPFGRLNHTTPEVIQLAKLIKANFQHVQLESLLTPKQQLDLNNYHGDDRLAYIKTRVNQNAFRISILGNYENKCAITGINIPELLIASHIIPWADDVEHRLDPSNGICFSALYDRAFDQGLITIDPNDLTVVLSKELKEHQSEPYYEKHFKSVERLQIIRPIEYQPNPNYLQYHIDHIFSKHN